MREPARPMVATAVNVAALVDPTVPPTATNVARGGAAARSTGVRIQMLNGSSGGQAAFATAREPPDAFFVGPGALSTASAFN